MLSGVRLERLRDFGDVWLAWGLWRMLGLDEFLEGLLESGADQRRFLHLMEGAEEGFELGFGVDFGIESGFEFRSAVAAMT